MRAIIYGGLVVGVLDALDAHDFFRRPLGRDAAAHLSVDRVRLVGARVVSGGMRTAALGVFFHFLIAFAIVAVYFVASRQLPVLTKHPVLYGIGYGLVVYA